VVDRDTFSRLVREALDRLGDRPFLEGHPLGGHLYPDRQNVTAEVLQQALFEAIAELRPPPGTPTTAIGWRHWRYLTLRYIDGNSTKQIARELLLSERHARREHLTATQAVADVLWSRYRAQHPETLASIATLPLVAEVSEADAGDQWEDLETEVARLAIQTSPEPANVGDVLRDVLDTTGSLARARHAQIRVILPETELPVAVSGVILRQILLCLITLALQDSASELVIEGEVSAEWLMLQLSNRIRGRPGVDSGSGDDPQRLLYVTRQLIEGQGGTLKGDRTEEGTLTLTAHLPLAQLTTVLVVDDNPDVVRLFQRYLAGRPYRLIQARTPPAVFELTRECHPDVITLDVLMPALDGWQILQRLRSNPESKDIPVIVCSIIPEKSLALSLGAAGFLAKPVTASSLLAALETCPKLAHRLEHRGYRGDSASSLPPTVRLID